MTGPSMVSDIRRVLDTCTKVAEDLSAYSLTDLRKILVDVDKARQPLDEELVATATAVAMLRREAPFPGLGPVKCEGSVTCPVEVRYLELSQASAPIFAEVRRREIEVTEEISKLRALIE